MKIWFYSCSLLLLGCNASDDQNHTSSPNYFAQNVIRQIETSDEYYVDLSQEKKASDGSDVIVTEVIPFSSDCNILSQDRDGFVIDASSVQVCDYRYRVGSSAPNSVSGYSNDDYELLNTEATARILVSAVPVSSATANILTPLSSVTRESTPIAINIPQELNKVGYTLDTTTYSLSATVSLPADSTTGSSVTVDTTNNSIEYSPGSGIATGGTERILYSYSDGTTSLAGTIDVAVSTGANTAPIANSKDIGTVDFDTKIEVDVNDVISDVDGDTLQLIAVFGFNSTTTIPNDANSDGNLFNDTVFEFISTVAGKNSVTYVVSDGKGGFGTGVIELEVAEPYKAEIINNIIYLPPLQYGSAHANNIRAKAVPGNGTTSLLNTTTASHHWEVAEAVCSSQGGRQLSITEIAALKSSLGSDTLFSRFGWPVDLSYWTSNISGDTATTYNMLNGNQQTQSLDDDGYAICIDSSPPGNVSYTVGTVSGSSLDEYLFDVRINNHVTFRCGYAIDAVSQIGGSHVGGTGGNAVEIDLDDIKQIRFGVGGNFGDLGAMRIYDSSNKQILNCGSNPGSVSWETYDVPDTEVLSGFKVFSQGTYIDGFEVWTSPKL